MRTSPTIEALAAALALAQGEFQPVVRDKIVTVATRAGGKYTFAYAPLDSIMSSVRDALNTNGLSIIHGIQRFDGGDVLETMLLHSSGQFLSTEVPLSVVGEGPQAYGSAMTYARRYAVTSILGLVAEDDDDANAGDGNEVLSVSTPEEREAERKAKCDAYVKLYGKEVAQIKDAIAAEDLPAAAAKWAGLPHDAKLALWVAPTKGGPFSTVERELMKTPGFRSAAPKGQQEPA